MKSSRGAAKPRVVPRNPPSLRPGPEGGTRDVNRRRRTVTIATAALTLFLERGVEAVTIDEIMARARLAKGSFYTYFRDKTDLVDALLAPVSRPLLDAMDRCALRLRAALDARALTDAYQSLALEVASPITEHLGVVRLYLQESRAPASGAREPVARLAREIQSRAVELTHAAHAHGLLRPLDPKVTAAAVVGAIEQILWQVLSGSETVDANGVVDTLVTLVLHGLKQP